MKIRKKWLSTAAVCLAFVVLIAWFLHSCYQGVNPLPLRTSGVKQFEELAEDQFDQLTKVTVEYWAFYNLQMKCYGSEWREEDAESVLPTILTLLSDSSFQASYAEKHDRRYGTDDGYPQSAMVYFYNQGEKVPAYQYVVMAPFERWEKIQG